MRKPKKAPYSVSPASETGKAPRKAAPKKKEMPDPTDTTVETLRRENASLRARLKEEQHAEELRDTLLMANVFGRIAAPISHAELIEQIVETAAQVLSAEAAALFLLDEDARELNFEVAIGGGGQAVKQFRVPLGKGIAGYVAETQQPLAVADVAADERWIGQLTDYVPRSILCVPMLHGERLIGVLELCDKQGADSFGLEDMQALGFFANMAATALQLAQTHSNVAVLLGEMLESNAALSSSQKKRLQATAKRVAAPFSTGEYQHDRLELARLVQSIIWQGENEFQACRALITGFADYLAARPATLLEWRTPNAP